MTRTTCELYRAVIAHNGRLCAASVTAFQEVFGSITVSGCWFHHSQAVLKCVNKLGLEEEDYHAEPWRQMTSRTIFAASWVCHCCLPSTSRLVCKRFVRPSAMTCRWLGSYRGWWRTFNVNGSTPGTPRLPSTRRTRLTDVKSVWFNRVLLWLWCHADIHVSVSVAQTNSRPWTVSIPNPHNGVASLRMAVWSFYIECGGFVTDRIRIWRTDQLACFLIVQFSLLIQHCITLSGQWQLHNHANFHCRAHAWTLWFHNCH